MHRRQILKAIPAMWLTAPAVAHTSTKQVENLETMLERLRSKIEQELPDLTSLQITYDPANVKVPLMVVALRV